MNKKILFMLLAVSLMLVGCTSVSKRNQETDSSTKLENDTPTESDSESTSDIWANSAYPKELSDFKTYEGVELSVVEDTYTGQDCTVSMTYSGTKEYGDITTGESFFIYKKNGDVWTRLEESDVYGWNEIGYLLGDKPLEIKCDWSKRYGQLGEGVYRLVKDFIVKGDGPNPYDTYIAYVEFWVPQS